jgi:hypothetical protein
MRNRGPLANNQADVWKRENKKYTWISAASRVSDCFSKSVTHRLPSIQRRAKLLAKQQGQCPETGRLQLSY